MNSICSWRISAPDTPRDRHVMSLQNGEIPPQPEPPRPMAMDSHDAHRAAGPHNANAPPAPRVATSGSDVSKATDQDAAAMASCGAGAVERTGSVVAPALFADGPGLPFRLLLSARVRRPICRPQTVMTACYPPRGRAVQWLTPEPFGAIPLGALGLCTMRVSPWTRLRLQDVRGDRSCHQPLWPAGTRSGDKREVSLSPVPASHIPGRSPVRAPVQAPVRAPVQPSVQASVQRRRLAARGSLDPQPDNRPRICRGPVAEWRA
jgi:hypothetical protein